MFKKLGIIFLAFFCLYPCAHAWGATTEVTQDMNVGTYIQTATTASGVLGYNSAVSNLSGLAIGSSSNNANAVIHLTGNKGKETISLSMQTSSVTLSNAVGCTIVAQSFTFSSSTISLQNNTQDVNIGTTLSISGGFCQEGTYSGVATVELSGKDHSTADFTIQVTIESPLSIEETTGMNFGTMLSPSTASSITLPPSGNYTSKGDITFVNSALTPGEFTVTGVGNRVVYISLPSSATISNGSQTMTVDNFVSDPAGNFILYGTGTNQTQNVKVGATLHLNAHQRSGYYTGTYPIIVSY